MECIKVLIVDDDRIILNGLTAMLDWESLGYKIVATAINGKHGINCFEEYMPHVVFMDIKMPVMDGLDMLEALQSTGVYARFIILSAFGEFSYAKQAIELGASAYILKEELNPESLSDLLAHIRTELEARSRSAFEEILEIALSFVEISETPLEAAVLKIQRQFMQYIDLQEEYSIGKMAANMDAIFGRVFNQYGKSAYYATPEPSSGEEFKQWVLEQMHRLDGWRLEDKRNLSPVIANTVFYLKENYCSRDLSVKAVSELTGMSEGRLSVLFKQEVGQTMKEYITDLRIEQAKRLLRQGQYKVYEIAEKVGFTSGEYFSRVFVKATGSPPQYYRKDEDI